MKCDFTLTAEQKSLVEGNLAVIDKVIARYINVNEHICGMGRDDLYQEGAVALCKASATYDGASAAFSTYATTVIRNHLFNHCKAIASNQRNLPSMTLNSDDAGDGRPPPFPEPSVPDDADSLIEKLDTAGFLADCKQRYSGVARLGIEALELKIKGLSGADIARLYQTTPNNVAVWTILNWRFLHPEEIEVKYHQMVRELPPARRTLDTCLNRLEMRGLIARGCGDTDLEALYDLLGELYVVPVSESLPLRLVTFIKLLLDGVPFSTAKQLFQRDKPNEREARVMALSRQALLSTAELIKCAEAGVSDVSTEEKLMDALIDNDYTSSDSIAFEMLQARQRVPVTIAVANLYLRKQVVFERI